MVYDTNVFVYAILSVEPFGLEATRALASSRRVLVPDSFRAELTNALWMATRLGAATLQDGLDAMEDAEGLVDEVVPSKALWRDALSLAVDANHPAYDTLFVALARQRGTRLVTYDRKLRRCFPDDTVSPGELGLPDAVSSEPTL